MITCFECMFLVWNVTNITVSELTSCVQFDLLYHIQLFKMFSRVLFEWKYITCLQHVVEIWSNTKWK